MTKINRRDYLKHMGTGAGVVIAGGGLHLFAQEKQAPRGRADVVTKNESRTATGEPEDPYEWQPSWPELPADKCVRLIFDGKTGFCPRPASMTDPTVHCDVGIQSKGDSEHNHRLSIHAYQIDDCEHPKLTLDNVEYADVKLQIEKPDTTISKGVAFYQPAKNVTSREDLKNHAADWRWIVDFESNYLYLKHLEPAGPKRLKKNRNVYKTMFTVKNGLFYTLRKTASTFRAQTKNGKHVTDLGNIADVHGANIYLLPGGKVTLTVTGKAPVDLIAPAEIYFSNRCLKDPDGDPHAPENHCDAEPYNLEEKKKRNDFYLNYQAFDYGVGTAQGTKEYELFLLEKHYQTAEPEPPVVCESDRFARKKLTDEAPCAGSGYGGGGGLPPFP